MEYTIEEHSHRFAAWTAARAVQRGFSMATTEVVRVAIGAARLRELVDEREDWPASPEAFDRVHRERCGLLMESFSSQGVDGATYGRAAKIIAVYLKTRVVLGGQHDHVFGRIAHPPIDRLLLQSVSRDPAMPRDLRRICRRSKWTGLAEKEYFDLIAILRRAKLAEPSFWRLERYWEAPD